MSIQHVASAIDVLQVASQRENVSSEVFVRLGQAQLLAGQTSQARMTLNRAKQLFPDENEIGELVTDLQSVSQDVATLTK
jgi:Flp pilus assembly protein TadD